MRIVNCARGSLADVLAMAVALKSGHVVGAAFDVFEAEPATDNVLLGFDNVIATPHLGASTTEAQGKVAFQVAGKMADYLMKGPVTNALNMTFVSAKEGWILKPHMAPGGLPKMMLLEIRALDQVVRANALHFALDI